MKGPNLSGIILGTDPLKNNRSLLQATALDDTYEAKHTAAVFNELSKGDIMNYCFSPFECKMGSRRKEHCQCCPFTGFWYPR